MGDAEVCIALARRCMMADLLDKADEYCTRAILVNPKWSQSWAVRAQVSVGMLMEEAAGTRTLNTPRNTILAKAIEDATKAIEVSESEKEGRWPIAEARALRAQLRFMNGEIDLGLQDAEAAYKLTPDVLHIILLRAQAHLMARETDSAIKLLAEGYAQEARPDIVLMYAKTLADRAKDGDLARAMEVAASADVSTIPARMRDSFVINAIQFMAQLDDWETASEYLRRQRAAIHPVTALAVDVLIHLGRKDQEAANRLADEALSGLSDAVQAGTKEFFAGTLMQLDRANEALPIFQELFDKDIPTFDPRQLIACADHLHLHKKVLDVCNQLHSRRLPDWQLLEFEVQHLEQYDRDKAIERLQGIFATASWPQARTASIIHHCHAVWQAGTYPCASLTFLQWKSFPPITSCRHWGCCAKARTIKTQSTMPIATYAATSIGRRHMKRTSRLSSCARIAAMSHPIWTL